MDISLTLTVLVSGCLVEWLFIAHFYLTLYQNKLGTPLVVWSES